MQKYHGVSPECSRDLEARDPMRAQFLRDNDVRPGCFGALDPDGEMYFSWRPCECCGETLGGDRIEYGFATVDGARFNAEICADCVYALEYGF